LNVWISTVGWSPFAVINPIWASCFFNKFIPQKIILLNNGSKNPKIAQNMTTVEKWINKILPQYGIDNPLIEPVHADEDDINNFSNLFKNVVLNNQLNSVAIDMTPGRKFMSSIAMACAIKYRNFVKKLFYLFLSVKKYQNTPFILIPFKDQKLLNILDVV